jgi:hypothetical protein
MQEQSAGRGFLVVQYDWTAVVAREVPGTRPVRVVFDVWEWNVWRSRWAPWTNGMAFEKTARHLALEQSDRIAKMLESNRSVPLPITAQDGDPFAVFSQWRGDVDEKAETDLYVREVRRD